MSAPAAAYPPTIRAICRTPVSFFQRFLEIFNYSEAKVFGLILCQTVGQSQEWNEIPMQLFEAATNVTRESIFGALSNLEGVQKLIRIRQGKSGRSEYAVAKAVEEECDVKGSTVSGRCPHCKELSKFDTEYVAVPHAAFRRLGAAVDHATYCVVMLIIRNSLRWTGAKGLWAEAAELELDDFERFTGLSKKSISNGIARALSLNLITRQIVSGRSSLYKAIPEAFLSLEAREPRTVEREQKAKTETPKTEEKPKNIEKEVEIESAPAAAPGIIYQCRKCRHFVEPEAVEEAQAEELDAADPPGPRKRPIQTESEPRSTEVEVVKRESFDLFWALFVASGKPLNYDDREKSRKLWAKYDEPTHEIIVRYVVEQMKTVWTSERFTPRPQNMLKDGGWTRVAAERIIPTPQPEHDEMWEIFNRLYAKDLKAS